jgi:peptidoglycan hydrolase-like protein with peptidoglycan-binding domain
MNFKPLPTYSRFRTLHRTDPMMRGYDVYALQTALVEMGLKIGGLDGVLGEKTQRAIKSAQSLLLIEVDGLCGGGTQQAITKRLANRARTINDLPPGLVFGQCMHESSCRLGMYSLPIRPDGSYDAGVAQRNSNYHDLEEAFTVEHSIELLGRNIRKHYDRFEGLKSDQRRWGLAAGAWNAPAYACWIAKNEGAKNVTNAETKQPSSDARTKLEAYIASATAHMKL